MNQLDLKFSGTVNRPLGLVDWSMTEPSVPRGFIVFTLSALSWGAVWMLIRPFA